MNLKSLANYLQFGRGVSVGTPNEASALKLPQLNTASITAASFNAGVTGAGITAFTMMPFFLTDPGPGGAPYVKCEQVPGAVQTTILTFNRLPFLVSNTSAISFGKLKLLTMPFGRFSINGGSMVFTQIDWSANNSVVQTTGAAGTVIGAGGSGDFSLGTTGTADSTLSSTDVDIIASTAFIDPFVAGIGNNVATPGVVLNTPVEFAGDTTATSGTAKTINLNIIVDDADVVDTNAGLMYLTGYLRLYTSWLGDM